ncbi:MULTISPECIES: subclass B3 metallo-beta-lactamase [unclassified Sphingopyxis]|uniref:subclass B3 metallo-beta-lactamase n=1 Tax=unclassified Sphingopyxis TaxID=2614943 RepID=UPI000730D070|nr:MULTISPECIES: subclass B3 metallo-beta-lactamase [unclassified Sphingopyxis]KTE28096.1 subclass B3 metallo-beta-lactamase [Sphingopyxis sp. H057]KTE55524.1 subclass B3 metallo-beta-lactamase [Sphingopyxis sp. H073]KTE57591.1 subclass B3 metallo-beta-lactamase [Sphingopyxis sp. H071]KTE57961.1 subclass B3 metallo-beta-lactamase [Sphingopyxis sp. H107]KTE66411.1 subclass B3 metallo-beta-lactamase [Sphingopyxis sp. H100]
MSGKLLLLAAVALAGCTPHAAPSALATAPTGKALAAACAGREGWSDPAPPAKIFGNSYYVGTCGISVVLIDTPAGLVLIDAATEEAAPSILANIRTLGFDPKNVRFLLTSHEHLDHVGGLKALQEATGAQVIARPEAAAALASGEPDATDPQRGSIPPFRGVAVARTVLDGEMLEIEKLRLTAHATPGHTPGGTSWTWRSCEGTDCRTIAYVDSLSAVSADGYRFVDHPDYVATFRATFAKVEALPCEILITPHPGASNLFARLANPATLANPESCRAYAAGARMRLADRLASESTPPK